jgi:hypothetical protein
MTEYEQEKKLHDDRMRDFDEELKIHQMHDEEEDMRRQIHPFPKAPSTSKTLVVLILINCLALEIFVCWYMVKFSEYSASSIYSVVGLIVPIIGCVGTIVPYMQKSTAENLHKYPDVQSDSSQNAPQCNEFNNVNNLPQEGKMPATDESNVQNSTKEEG